MNDSGRLYRFRYRSEVRFGVEQDDTLRLIEGDVFGEHRVTDRHVGLGEIDLLSPCTPTKVVAIGLNYRDHALERNKPVPKDPLMFMKPSTAVIGPGETIRVPVWAGRIDHEAELAVVIGRAARHVKADDAGDYILGFTCFNDVTARQLQGRDVQFTRAKSFDTFAPVGPCISPLPLEQIEQGLTIELSVNGSLRQSSSTSNLIFKIPYLVEYISRVMTLLPGDLIATGTPSGIGILQDGDDVAVSIEGIGILRNPVAADIL